MLELTIENAPTYLRQQGWVDDSCQVEELSGGVSNVVLRVMTSKSLNVLKQSRAQLRTSDPWFSDLSRIFREIDAMQLLGPRLEPGIVPLVHFRDDANYAFLMCHAPRNARDWRTVLLQGEVETGLGRTAGRILGQIHQATSGDHAALGAFRDRTVFEQLRVEPFYRRVAERCPDAAPVLKLLIEDMAGKSICLCHGDFSPKNLLLHESAFTLVDYETAHLGDPGFDIGFFLSHLFLKALMHPARWPDFELLLTEFWLGYEGAFRFSPFDMLVSTGLDHLGGCLLARVDGTSPAPYLIDPRRKDAARRIAKGLLLEPTGDWAAALDLLGAECEALEQAPNR
jgi:5-methylthioribose kinase